MFMIRDSVKINHCRHWLEEKGSLWIHCFDLDNLENELTSYELPVGDLDSYAYFIKSGNKLLGYNRDAHQVWIWKFEKKTTH